MTEKATIPVRGFGKIILNALEYAKNSWAAPFKDGFYNVHAPGEENGHLFKIESGKAYSMGVDIII